MLNRLIGTEPVEVVKSVLLAFVTLIAAIALQQLAVTRSTQSAGQTDSLGMLVGYGNLVRIQADSGRIDYYGHMTAFAVQRGDVVQTGQVIGFVGSTGYSTGPHLHFEVRVSGVPVDPAPYLRPC